MERLNTPQENVVDNVIQFPKNEEESEEELDTLSVCTCGNTAWAGNAGFTKVMCLDCGSVFVMEEDVEVVID